MEHQPLKLKIVYRVRTGAGGVERIFLSYIFSLNVTQRKWSHILSQKNTSDTLLCPPSEEMTV